MRPIRFRAWDKEKNRMRDDFTMTSLGYIAFEFDNYLIKKEDTILMQFTGLLDKQGKEIYEGDIVKVDETSYPENRTIEWGFHSDHSSYMYQLGWNIWEEEVIEVIGNIYENPSLL